MNIESLVMVSPHNWYDHVRKNKINRPLKLAEQFYHGRFFKNLLIVNRIKPRRIIFIEKKALNEREIIRRGFFYNIFFDSTNRVYYLEHCFPFGFFESQFLPHIINKSLKYLGFKDFIIWLSDPKSANVLKHFNTVTLFDAYDDWSLSPLFKRNKRHMKFIVNGYNAAKQFATIILTNSEYMKNKLKRPNGNIFIISNTTSLQSKYCDKHITRKNKQSKIVGYIGNIHERLDLNIVELLLNRYPDILFLFIGKNDFKNSAFNKLLDGYNNIRHLSAIPYESIPNHIMKFDVCIVPHKVDKYTLSQDSMKIYDYLAFGKPIVTTNIPPADKLAELVYIARDDEDFINKISIALSERNKSLSIKRIKYVQNNSWNKKSELIYKLIMRCSDAKSVSMHCYME